MPISPTVDEVEARVADLLVDSGVDRADITREATLMYFDIDSVDLAELAMVVKDDYDVELPQHAVSPDKTVGDVVDYIMAHVGR
jgi:acyl carrier protein